MFPDVGTVRSVQTELDTVIEEGVANIVQLLRNAETGVSSGAARLVDDDAFEAKNRQKNRFKKWVHDSGKLMESKDTQPNGRFTNMITEADEEKRKVAEPKRGRLTDQLVSQGLLTKDMLDQLKREWEVNKQRGRNKSAPDVNSDDE